jgi:eukaryotic-like serine/threonine-protein kinase
MENAPRSCTLSRVTLRVGRYETLRAIASGGMATVYLGRALGAGGFERLVALKVMHPHIAAEPEFVAMFLDEARLAARVRHPNVVATIDLVEDPLFLVMEYIEGPSLHLLLRTCARAKRPFPLGIALRVFLDMLAGLHAAHELTDVNGELLNLVHRDVSPQNVLVGVDGVSRITDFGVARAESRLNSTRGTTLKGKLGYMPPEQVRGEPVDRRGDVYAAGVVLWEMLTEHRLFKAENEGALITQILGGPRQGLRELAPSVPVAIERVCMRALRSDPQERFATAAAFCDAVEQAIASTPGMAIASSRPVAAFIKELGLHAQPEQLTGPAMAAIGGPSSSSAPRSYPHSQALPAMHPTLLHQPSGPMSSVQGIEPTSGTAIGAVVSEAAMFRPSVMRRGLVAGTAVVALALGVGALLTAGREPSTPAASAAAASSSGMHAADRVQPEARAPADGLPDAGSPAAPSADTAPGAVRSSPSSRSTRASSVRGTPPKATESARSNPTPRTTPPTPFRPTEL